MTAIPRRLLPMLLLLVPALLPPAAAAPAVGSPRQLERRSAQQQQSRQLKRRGHVPQAAVWNKALQRAITDIHNQGPGGYSTEDAAHEALERAFVWNERSQRLLFHPAGARPSFCSGAVYAALLSALIHWDAAQPKRRISAEAWKALAPRHVKDGEGPWGCANANGPGFALLVHRLGAGVSFTDWRQAQPGDVAKFWWTDEIGGRERGHLVILVRDEGDSVRVWSSNRPTGGAADGFGFKSFPKKAVRRALFTRITNPAAFNRASALGSEPWLTELMSRAATWEECAARCGFRP